MTNVSAAAPNSTLWSKETLRVLIVEDSPKVQQRLMQSIQTLPNTEVVGLAATAQQAVEQTVRLSPDVLVLDLRLREGSGIEVLRATRKSNPHTAVFIFSTLAHGVVKSQCLAEGALACFDKSLELDEFLDHLRSFGSGSRYHCAAAGAGDSTKEGFHVC
jgi:DNA-binding NarL/FixJ family response regulator